MKLFKKLASFILAFAMVMAIAMPSVVMAVDNGSITITGAKAGHTFEAYQIFTGKVSAKHFQILHGVVELIKLAKIL